MFICLSPLCGFAEDRDALSKYREMQTPGKGQETPSKIVLVCINECIYTDTPIEILF